MRKKSIGIGLIWGMLLIGHFQHASAQVGTDEIPFQYHIGGFISPYQAFKKVYLDALNKNVDYIAVDFSTIFDQSILSRPKTIMRPCKDAIDFLDRFIESIKTIYDE